MQFTSIIATLSMVLAATALPSPNPVSGNSCQQGTKLSCCSGNSSGSILGGSCVLDILNVLQCGILNGAQQACCQTDSTGLIVANLPCQLL